MIEDISEIKFLGMAYSPVVANLDEERKWQRSTLDSEFDDKTIEHFEKYIQSLWNSETEKSKPYSVTFREDDKDIEEILKALKDLNINSNGKTDKELHAEFNRNAKKASDRLIQKMDMRASEGVLFTIQFQAKNAKYVSLLKLDLRETGWSSLNPDTHRIEYKEIENALPEPEGLQKGAIYPTPTDPDFSYFGNLLLVQTDGYAQYFHEFLDVERRPSHGKQFDIMVKTLDTYKKKKVGSHLDPDDFERIINELESKKTLKSDDFEQVGSQIVGTVFDTQEFEKIVKRKKIDDISIDRKVIKNRRLEFELDDIKIFVPMESKKKIKWNKDRRGNHTIVIKGTNLKIKKRRL